MLTEIKTDLEHYYVDELNKKQGIYISRYANTLTWCIANYTDGRRQGECTVFYDDVDNTVCARVLYHNDRLHGECVYYDCNKTTIERSFQLHGNDITKQVAKIVNDMYNITDEEKLLIKIKWGIECLSPTPLNTKDTSCI